MPAKLVMIIIIMLDEEKFVNRLTDNDKQNFARI
jgi:hypothetical protein